jgi:uncharacterized protein
MSPLRPPLRRLVATFLLLAWAATAFAALEVPYLRGRVTDDAEILSPGAVERIGARLQAHESSSTDQVAVLTVTTLDGESIESFALRVFEAWQLGRKGKDNGVLLVISPQDRSMRIEVGYGLEGRLTDLEAGRIIRNILAPRFKAGQFDAGVEEGVDAIVSRLEGSAPDLQETPPPAGDSVGGFGDGPDLPLTERILFGAFIFGIIGLFTVLGVLTPGMGWFLYFFLIPFWAMFPIVVVGTRGALILLVTYLIAFPTAKIVVSRSGWYRKARTDLRTKGQASIGGFTLRAGGSGGSGSSSWSSGGGSSFSGGGGHSGGGGASGSW